MMQFKYFFYRQLAIPEEKECTPPLHVEDIIFFEVDSPGFQVNYIMEFTNIFDVQNGES